MYDKKNWQAAKISLNLNSIPFIVNPRWFEWKRLNLLNNNGMPNA